MASSMVLILSVGKTNFKQAWNTIKSKLRALSFYFLSHENFYLRHSRSKLSFHSSS